MNDHPEYSTPQAQPAVRTVPGGAATASGPEIGDPFAPQGAVYFLPVPDQLARIRSLGPGPKLLYAALMWHARQSTRCWPSIRRLGVQLGAGRNSIKRWSHELARAGFIRRPNKRAFPNHWILLYMPPLTVQRAPFPGR